MILTQSFYTKYCSIRQPNLYLRGNTVDWLHDTLSPCDQPVQHKVSDDIFAFNFQTLSKPDKLKALSFIQELSQSVGFFQSKLPKLLLLFFIEDVPQSSLPKLKQWLETPSHTSSFILHSQSVHLFNLADRCLCMTLPQQLTVSHFDQKMYDKFLVLLKQPFTSSVISSIREFCYMYYLTNKTSDSFQRYVQQQITSNEYLPNVLKERIVKDMAHLNHLYQTSYRKSLYLETILYSVFKHLDHYKTNL